MTREETKKHFKLWCQLYIGNNASDEDYHMFNNIMALLEQEPRRKGHWIKHNTPHSTYYDCSLCGCAAPCTETADRYIWKLSNFCPDCGADMREAEE